MSASLVDWLSHTLDGVEESVFEHWRALYALTKIVDLADSGEVHRYVAESAIAAHNDRATTAVTYEEVSSRSGVAVFSIEGEWVVFTDDARKLIASVVDPTTYCDLANSDESIEWVLFWNTQENTLIVLRSPHRGLRGGEVGGFVEGLSLREEYDSFVLPSGIEGAIRQDLNNTGVENEFNSNEQNRRRQVGRTFRSSGGAITGENQDLYARP